MSTQPQITPRKDKINWVGYCYECKQVKCNGFKSHVEPCVQFHLSLCPGPMYIRRVGPSRRSPYWKYATWYAVTIVLPNEEPDLALPNYDPEEGN